MHRLQRCWRKDKGKRKVQCPFALPGFSIVESIFKIRCKKCKGEKTVKEKTRQEVFIEKGMNARQRIVLAGAGDQKVC